MKVYSTAPYVLLNYQGSKEFDLSVLDNNVLHIEDVFTDESFIRWTSQSSPKYVVNDRCFDYRLPESRSQYKDKIYYAPFWIAELTERFKPDPDPVVTNEYTFNFMINKKQVNRYLCIKLIEMFGLTNYTYTWSGIGRSFDLTPIIRELESLDPNFLTEEQHKKLFAPIEIPERFINDPDLPRTNDFTIPYPDNVWAWKNIFCNFFPTSAISLITESLQFEQTAAYTEKSLFPVLGLTFPIWVGGYNQAHWWKRLGFDIFDDIIDHSYQDYPTLFERCYYAIEKNLKLLENKELATELHKKHMDRLVANRNLLLNGRLLDFCHQSIAEWPQDLQQTMPEIIKWYPKIKHLF